MIAAERTVELSLFLVWADGTCSRTARVVRAANHRAAAERLCPTGNATLLVCRCNELPHTYTVTNGHAERGIPARRAAEDARDSARMAVASADRALAMIGGR
jgi:hypothetical protein